jgi:hypothetical protein
MSFPPPGAPPFFTKWFFESRIREMGFEVGFYLKGPVNVVDAMTLSRAGLLVYNDLMVPDLHVLKIGVYDNNPSLLRDGWIYFPTWGQYSGTYAPTTGDDIAALDYQTGIQTRWQNTSTGVHETRHIRPVPRTLVTDGNVLAPDTFYSAALLAWENWLTTNAYMVTKSPGGTALSSNISETVENLRVVRVPGGEPHFLERGRARSATKVPVS